MLCVKFSLDEIFSENNQHKNYDFFNNINFRNIINIFPTTIYVH